MESIRSLSLSCCHDNEIWPPSPQCQKALKVAGWSTGGAIAGEWLLRVSYSGARTLQTVKTFL